MRIAGYIDNSIVDGSGIRSVVFFQGCRHHCVGCHNAATWNPSGGEEVDVLELAEKLISSPYNITFSGGEPLDQPTDLLRCLTNIKLRTHTNIWVYTGYTWEEIISNPDFRDILLLIDVLVDGRFEKDKANPNLLFRGSSNQRIIDVRESLNTGSIIEWRRKRSELI